jgi:tetratricopeptide (TPR) repeat protein
MKSVSIFILLTLVADAAQTKPRETQLLSEARALLLQGKRPEAVSVLRNTGSSDLIAKSILVGQQFVTTENFQKYQEMVAYHDARLWGDCIRLFAEVTSEDQSNLLLLRVYGSCLMHNGQYSESARAYYDVLKLNPKDTESVIGLATISMHKKEYALAEKILEPIIKSVQKSESERLALLRAEIKYFSGDLDSAIEILQKDHETNFDHLEVIFKLADFLQKKNGEEWQARRAFALFTSRYKKLIQSSTNKLRTSANDNKKLENLYLEAQARLAVLDKKLEISSENSAKKTESSRPLR